MIGEARYIEALEAEIFGRTLLRGECSEGLFTWGDSLAADLALVVKLMTGDVGGIVGDAHISFENRTRLLEAAAELSKIGLGSRLGGFESDVKRWQRLEDFDHAVIEFDTTGEVRARMAWENGENVMYITADVVFVNWFLDSNEFERRVEHAIENFKLWGGNYTVFDGQDLRVEVEVNRHDEMAVLDYGSAYDTMAVHNANPKTGETGVAVVNIANAPGDRPRSMAWGGKGIFDWGAEREKAMLLFDDFTGYRTAMHEFGHWLGLQDAYETKNDFSPLGIPIYKIVLDPRGRDIDESQFIRKYGHLLSPNQEALLLSQDTGLSPLLGPPKDENENYLYSDYDPHTIMNEHWIGEDEIAPYVTNNDVEMVVLAFHTNQRQNYQIQFMGQEISDAFGRGN
jgi:hypothetical protein